MSEWVLHCDASVLRSLAELRLVPDIDIAWDGESLWVRGPEPEGEIRSIWFAVPARDRFRLRDGLLYRLGEKLPARAVPDADWQPLRSVVSIEVPTPGLSASRIPRCTVNLVRTGTPREITGVVVTVEEWLRFGTTAPAVRMRTLRFAMTPNGRVFVDGSPFTASSLLRGTPIAGVGRIAIESGFHWSPVVDAEVIETRFGVIGEDRLLWLPGRAPEQIRGEFFTGATRTAIRTSCERVSGDAG